MRLVSLQLISILITVVLAVAAAKSQIHSYEFEISAILFMLLFILKFIPVRDNKASRSIMAVVFTFISMFIVMSTGATRSDFFFLIHFLLFAVSLMLEPFTSIILTIFLMFIFTYTIGENQTMHFLLPIISLGFISPFAMYLGNEYELLRKEQLINEKIEEDALLFTNLKIKKQLEQIQYIVDNFKDKKDLEKISNEINNTNLLISGFDKQIEEDSLITDKHTTS